MPKPNFLYSTNARWYVCLCPTETAGQFAVVVYTASRGDCFALLAPNLNAAERIESAAAVVAQFYDHEDWYRLPQEVRCREPELTDALRRSFAHIPVRTDRKSRTFRDLAARFRRSCA